MFNISYGYIDCSNNVEMRKADLVIVGDELYEIIRRIPYQRFIKNIEGDNAKILKEWIGCEKILKSNQTNEYLFVNLIEEATIIDETH